MMMHDTDPNSAPEPREEDASRETPLRRRENRPVEVERRRNGPRGFDIGAMLEMHLDQCKTRRAMINMLDQWLSESRSRPPENQDAAYMEAIQRAIDVMKGAPDVETAIVMLQQRY